MFSFYFYPLSGVCALRPKLSKMKEYQIFRILGNILFTTCKSEILNN